MDRDTQRMRIAKWKSNRSRDQISMLIAIVIFAVGCYPYNITEPTLTQAIAICAGVFFLGLSFFFHERASRCPVCNKKFADAEEYSFGETSGLALTDVVSRCPFCDVVLEGDEQTDVTSDKAKETSDGEV